MIWPFKDEQRWSVGERTKTTVFAFTGKELRRFYDHVGNGPEYLSGINPSLLCENASRGDRVTDRALQILRRAGLIQFAKGKWTKTEPVVGAVEGGKP